MPGGLLWAATSRHLLRHPAQLALALVGLALGVASIVAVDIATGSAGRAFELSMAAVSGPATHEISAGPAGIDETLYAELVRRLHVIRPWPIIEGYVTVGDEALQLLGVDPLAAAEAEDGSASAGQSGAAAARTNGASGIAGEAGAGGLRAWLQDDGAVLAPQTLARLGLKPGDAISGKLRRCRLQQSLAGLVRVTRHYLLAPNPRANAWSSLSSSSPAITIARRPSTRRFRVFINPASSFKPTS